MGLKKAKKIAIIGFVLIALSFFLDDLVNEVILMMRGDILTALMYFITDFGLLFLMAVIVVVCLWRKKFRMLMFMVLCAMLAFESAFLLKLIFGVPRPYLLESSDPLFLASGYAFPSMHAAFIASLVPFQKAIFRRRNLYFIYLMMIAIVFSRMYLGVHNLSDIVAGLSVGYLATYTFLGAEQKYAIIHWFKSRMTDKFELRRQSAHLFIGILIVFLLKLQLLTTSILFIICGIGLILVLIARKVRIPLIHDALEFFERPHHIARFPGRGSFFLVLGAALSSLIFEKDIAMAAIMVMAVGDSVTNIIGRHFGKFKNPFNTKKNLEGTFWGIIAATLGALLFVPFWPAFWASTIAMIIESLDLGWKRRNIELDDNVLIPLVAGAIMTVVI